MTKRKSGHDHRTDAKRRKEAQIQMSRSMSAFLDPRPDVQRNLPEAENDPEDADGTVPTVVISPAPSDDASATTQSSSSTRLFSATSTAEVLQPTTTLVPVQREAASILTSQSSERELEPPPPTAANNAPTMLTQSGAKPSTSVRQLGITSFITARAANDLPPATNSFTATPTQCVSSVEVLSPATNRSSLVTPRSTPVELVSPVSHPSTSTTPATHRRMSSLVTPRINASTVELVSPVSHPSTSATPATHRRVSSLVTPRSRASTVEMVSPVSSDCDSSETPAPNDIATAFLHPGGPTLLPDNQKLYLLQQSVQPPGDPANWPGLKRSGEMRRITPFCYDQYGKWLTYSEHYQGLFCKYCVFFETSKDTMGRLVTKPCRKFDRLTGSDGYLHYHHYKAEYHKENERKAKNFEDSCENRSKPITDQLDTASASTKLRNRNIISSIAEVVVLCARMGSAFRGHRDDGAVLPPDTITEIVTKQGNFRALVQLYSMANDHLKDHLSTCGANASYVSKTIQNYLIRSMGLSISSAIAVEVREAKFYTILADETTDASRNSQLSLSLRYLKHGNIVERFVGFVNPKSLTGEGLASEIVALLTKLGLDLTNVVGQGYDGAAAMSSEAKGVHGVMKRHCGKQAVFVHCAAHALNLTLMKASDVPQIRNAFGTICSVANFFNSSTVRSDRLETALETSETTHSKRSLKAPCQTRWVEKHEAVHTLFDLYQPLTGLLDDMSIERGTASRDASSLVTCTSTTEFVVSLCILNEVMKVTKQLCIVLQSATNSLVAALSYIKTVRAQLDIWRNDVAKFEEIAAKAKTLLGTDELSIPRVVGRQTKRANVPHSGPTDYYRKSIYLPFMDCLLTQFDSRFESHDKLVYSFSSLLPKSVQTAQFSDVHDSIALYERLLPGTMETIEIEFESWKIHCSEKKSSVNDCLAAMDICPIAFYPNINALLSIYATLPVSTATPERTFSALKQIKTYLRSTMTEERLNGLALAYITKDFDIERTVKEMVNDFASQNRRLLL